MKYECIKECVDLDFSTLMPKRHYRPGRIYEFEHTPDSRFFRRVPGERKKKTSKICSIK